MREDRTMALDQNSIKSSTNNPFSRKTRQTCSKISRQICKKRPKVIRQAKPTSTAASTSSSQQSLPATNSSIQAQNTTPSSSSQMIKHPSFELHNFIPHHIQNDNQQENGLEQIWSHLGTIGEHLMQLQAKFPLSPLNYSPYFGPNQRIRSISLISNCCSRLGLRLETQFLAFDIFHRICTAPPFERYHSALKAATSLYIAAKYEQICPPRASVFSDLDPLQPIASENIIKLESKILIYLNFNLSFAIPLHFAQLLSMRYKLQDCAQSTLLQLCMQSVVNEQLWMGGSCLLAMACVWVVMGRVQEWQQGELGEELKWRVRALHELLRQ